MNQPEFETLRLDVAGDAATATLSRADKLNAVSGQLLEELILLTNWLNGQDAIHFLTLDHDGPVFSAGADLSEARDTLSAPRDVRTSLRANQRVAQDALAKLAAVDQITFAALRGSAYGAGVAIAMACDFRIMADDAVLNLPETKLGMFLTYAATPPLVATMGLARAKEMILFAQDWDAQSCLAGGLVQRVTGRDAVCAQIEAMIAILRERSWPALRVSKQVANASVPAGIGNLGMTEVELAAESLAGGDVAMHLEQFLKRRE